MNEQLTIDDYEVLDFMVTFSNPVGWWFNNGNSTFWQHHTDAFRDMWDRGYLANEGEYTHDSFRITDTGRQALAAHKAQRDLVLFIAEFEEQLAEMGESINSWQNDDDAIESWERGYKSAYKRINTIYRTCKERIEANGNG